MSLRIAYWTSGFEPSMEAVSSEVHLLRRSFPRSVVWGLSHRRCVACPSKNEAGACTPGFTSCFEE